LVQIDKPLKTIAVIDVGTTAIRMIIAEIDPQKEIRYLENLSKPVRFGKDVFASGRISSEGIREGIEILKNFKEVAKGYAVDKIQAIATSAVREAVNRDHFSDQVFVRTGIDLEILEGPEQHRLELIAVEHALQGKVSLAKKNCLIIEVGSGSTELIILDDGKVEMTRVLSIGSLRLPEKAIAAKMKATELKKLLKRHVLQVLDYASNDFQIDKVDLMIALGGDMRFLAQEITPGNQDTFYKIDKKEFSAFIAKIGKKTPEDIAEQYGMQYDQAEMLYPALLMYSDFLDQTKAEEIIVPRVSIRDGLLLEYEQMLSGYKRTDVAKQVLNSAKHLGVKYKYDKANAANVASLAVQLFDALTEDHGLDSKARLLLEVSALLHDIGSYVSPTSRHKHSSYLIQVSEIFGLRKAEKKLVATVVRYHRGSDPKPTHVEYLSLPRADRAMVSKLAAILRVAVALDESGEQRIRQFTLEKSARGYIIWVSSELMDISVERTTLQTKGKLFGEVFCTPIDLKIETPQT
jgi:exopolyphosphatase/guanosine-5'-triphosphate,3'-diphosphate pyrophosphatase